MEWDHSLIAMIETHPFPYYLPPLAEKLIVGSFPCSNGKDYGDWFYGGSGRNYFWRLLSDTLGMPADTQKEKIKLCEQHRIALSDVAYRIQRLKGNCSDANLKIVEFNTAGIDRCLEAGVTSVFFTGKFVEQQFKKMYPQLALPNYVLASPSPAANRHIGGLQEYKELRKNKTIATAYDYRLLNYRKLLS